MNRLSLTALESLLAVALTSDVETEARVDALRELARACHETDASAARRALREAVHSLERASPAPDADLAELSEVAHRLGRTAEDLREYPEARQAYQLAAKLADAGRGGADAGVIWHDIGDTWVESGDGKRALAAYHKAAEYKAQNATVRSYVDTLRAVARTEFKYGVPDECDRAFAAALDRLSRAVHALGAPAVAGLAAAVASDAQRFDRLEYARKARALATSALDPGVDSTPARSDNVAAPPPEAIELLDHGRKRRLAGELEPARADLQRANDLLQAAGTSASDHLAAAARELRIVDRALAEPAQELTVDLKRRTAARGERDPDLDEVLEALAAHAAARRDTATARHALEWVLALDFQPAEERQQLILEALRPFLDDAPVQAKPPPLPVTEVDQLGNPHRIWAFGLRRRTVDSEDLRAAIHPILPDIVAMLLQPLSGPDRSDDAAAASEWLAELYPAHIRIDDELLRDHVRLRAEVLKDLCRAWDEREGRGESEGFGEELTRALERFLLQQVIDQRWPEHAKRCAELAEGRRSGELSGDDFATHLWTDFFTLLFRVQVEVEENSPE